MSKDDHYYNIIRSLIRVDSSETSESRQSCYEYLSRHPFEPENQYEFFFKFIGEYYRDSATFPRYKQINQRLVEKGEVNKSKKLEAIRDLPVPELGDFVFSVGEIRKIQVKKQIMELCNKTIDSLDIGNSDLSNEVLENTVSDLIVEASKVNPGGIDDNSFISGSMGDSYDSFVQETEDKRLNKASRQAVFSGVKIIDEYLQGINPGNLVFVCAFTGQFKTGSCVNWAMNAVLQGKNTLFITMENSFSELRAQFLSSHACNPMFNPKNIEIPTHSQIHKATFSTEQERFIREIYKDIKSNEGDKYGHLFLHQPEKVDFSLSDVRNTCVRYNNECGGNLDFLVLDSPSLLAVEKGSRDFHNRNWIIRELKMFATGFNNGRGLAVLAPHQINRDGYHRAKANDGVFDHKCVADLNEVERSSDGLITLYLDEDLRKVGQIKVQFLKTRHEEMPTEPVLVTADLGRRKWGDDFEELDLNDLLNDNIVENIDWNPDN